MVKYLTPFEFSCPNGDICELRVEFLDVSSPTQAGGEEVPLYPHQCRRQGTTYGGELRLSVRLSINGTPSPIMDIPCGAIPIMVLSRACNLSKLNRKDFPKHLEEERELETWSRIHRTCNYIAMRS